MNRPLISEDTDVMPPARRRSKPPSTHDRFVARFPALGAAWSQLAEVGQQGPLDEKTARLVKLAIAAGALREGAVHAAVRRALDAGATRDEIEHIVVLAAGTLGFPATVAVYTWMQDVLATTASKARRGSR